MAEHFSTEIKRKMMGKYEKSHYQFYQSMGIFGRVHGTQTFTSFGLNPGPFLVKDPSIEYISERIDLDWRGVCFIGGRVHLK